MAETVPVTPVAGLIIVGPWFEHSHLHDLLIERAALWRLTPMATDSVSGTPWTAGSAEAAVRDAIRSVDEAGGGNAAVVDPEHRVTTFLELLGEGRTRWTGIRSLADLELEQASHRGRGDVLTILAPWGGLLVSERLSTHDSVSLSAVAVRTCGPVQPHRGLGWAAGKDLALRNAVLSGLRSMSAAAVPTLGRVVAGASGATEWSWLLDGSLSLLTAYSQVAQRRSLPDTRFDVVIRHIPELSGSLRLAVVVRRSSGIVVAAAWGRQTDEAIAHALTAARTRSLLPVEAVGSSVPDPPETAPLINSLSADGIQRLLHEIHAVVFGHYGRRVLGVRVAADALLGRQDLAWGPVWFG